MQVASIKRGFAEIVPHEFLDMFDERELELVIGGLGEIDMDDWKRNTEYRYCEPTDAQVPLRISIYVCHSPAVAVVLGGAGAA